MFLRIMHRNAIFRYTGSHPITCQLYKTQYSSSSSDQFETVFHLPAIKYFTLFNRLKVYQIAGASVGIPLSGILTMLNVVPKDIFEAVSYTGLTAAAMLMIASIPFKNIIGYIYISHDNKQIKISSVDYWGRRIDKILPTDNWTPLYDMPSKLMDPFYLSPELTDGTKYKLLVKFGNILNPTKMGRVLE